jgi:hypothetical protein
MYATAAALDAVPVIRWSDWQQSLARARQRQVHVLALFQEPPAGVNPNNPRATWHRPRHLLHAWGAGPWNHFYTPADTPRTLLNRIGAHAFDFVVVIEASAQMRYKLPATLPATLFRLAQAALPKTGPGAAETIHIALANKFYKRVAPAGGQRRSSNGGNARLPLVLVPNPQLRAVAAHAADVAPGTCIGVAWRAFRSHSVRSADMKETDFKVGFAAATSRLQKDLAQLRPRPTCVVAATDFTLGPAMDRCADGCPAYLGPYRAALLAELQAAVVQGGRVIVLGNATAPGSPGHARLDATAAAAIAVDPTGLAAWLDLALLVDARQLLVVGGHFGEAALRARNSLGLGSPNDRLFDSL